jgi:hypothetical protein
MLGIDAIIDWLWPRRLRKRLRICARCQRQIKRHEHWSRKMWTDGRTRHLFNCMAPPPISVEKLGNDPLPTAEYVNYIVEAGEGVTDAVE